MCDCTDEIRAYYDHRTLVSQAGIDAAERIWEQVTNGELDYPGFKFSALPRGEFMRSLLDACVLACESDSYLRACGNMMRAAR